MRSKIFLTLTIMLLVSATVSAQDLAGIKCIINGKTQASPDAFVEYLDGKVYFCCENCVAKFETELEKENSELFTKANHQLVLTGQYVQKGCPISGHAVVDGVVAKVGGTEVGLCCKNCLAKVDEAADLAAKAELVFSRAAFDKGYEFKKPEPNLKDIKCMMMLEEDVVADQFVEVDGGKVYFCCGGCKKKFAKDPAAYTAQANLQLVATGQVKQVNCPISGSEYEDEISVDVHGVAVKVCCQNCLKKINSANDGQKLELVFGSKGYKRGYVSDDKVDE